MNVEGYYFPFTIRATDTCTYRRFNTLTNFKMLFWAFSCGISAFADALCAERQMNVDSFSGTFSGLILVLESATSVLKNKNTNILSMANLVCCGTV
jgi:hypothetical protein